MKIFKLFSLTSLSFLLVLLKPVIASSGSTSSASSNNQLVGTLLVGGGVIIVVVSILIILNKLRGERVKPVEVESENKQDEISNPNTSSNPELEKLNVVPEPEEVPPVDELQKIDTTSLTPDQTNSVNDLGLQNTPTDSTAVVQQPQENVMNSADLPKVPLSQLTGDQSTENSYSLEDIQAGAGSEEQPNETLPPVTTNNPTQSTS